MSVKRYTWTELNNLPGAIMEADPKGAFVKYSDYQAEAERHLASTQAIRKALDRERQAQDKVVKDLEQEIDRLKDLVVTYGNASIVAAKELDTLRAQLAAAEGEKKITDILRPDELIIGSVHDFGIGKCYLEIEFVLRAADDREALDKTMHTMKPEELAAFLAQQKEVI